VDQRIEEQLKRLPAKPGVYLFRDASGRVLYIGKAKSLRPRVRSYFQQGGDGRPQLGRLPAMVADVEVIVTGNEAEALHVEQNLVKRHRPPFNIACATTSRSRTSPSRSRTTTRA
jgi:excinuclease ABC subunit C